MSAPAVIRPVTGLMLSIGLPPRSPGNPGNHPKRLDHFRPKPGALNQYLPAVQAFVEAYGPDPRSVDVMFVSDDVNLVLDIRPKAFGTSGLKALGTRNLAALEPDEFQEALYQWQETVDVFPDDDSPVVQYDVNGPTDPALTKSGLKMYGVLRFSIPEVTGLMTLAEISTTSRRSMKNLYAGLRLARSITGGHLIGIPLRLSVRPAKGRYLDAETGKKRSTTFYELVIDSRGSLADLYETIMERRQILESASRLALPPISHADPDRDEEFAPAAIEAATDVPAVSVEVFDEESAGDGGVPSVPASSAGDSGFLSVPADGEDGAGATKAGSAASPADESPAELFPIPETARQ